jgi:hypothetical protein
MDIDQELLNESRRLLFIDSSGGACAHYVAVKSVAWMKCRSGAGRLQRAKYQVFDAVSVERGAEDGPFEDVLADAGAAAVDLQGLEELLDPVAKNVGLRRRRAVQAVTVTGTPLPRPEIPRQKMRGAGS